MINWKKIWKNYMARKTYLARKTCVFLAYGELNTDQRKVLQQLVEKQLPKVIYICCDDATADAAFATFDIKIAKKWAATQGKYEKWYYKLEIK